VPLIFLKSYFISFHKGYLILLNSRSEHDVVILLELIDLHPSLLGSNTSEKIYQIDLKDKNNPILLEFEISLYIINIEIYIYLKLKFKYFYSCSLDNKNI
jgi:hypothetical protein